VEDNPGRLSFLFPSTEEEIMLLGIIGVIAVICGLMGAWTGAGASKMWRRVGIPLLLVIFAYGILGNGWVIMLMLMSWVYSMGYGIPTPPNDPGSPLGAFWYKYFNGNVILATAATRATIGVCLGLSVIIIPFITAQWLVYLFFFVLLVFNQVLWTVIVTNMGQFPFLGRMLNWEEFFIYSCNALLVAMMIIL
jgi:hypothetical protein